MRIENLIDDIKCFVEGRTYGAVRMSLIRIRQLLMLI